MDQNRKATVFIMLGQSNAVGHDLPMRREDYITTPLTDVFGLHREENQSFDVTHLTWRGYESGGMNLAEEQDHTYSVPNCLARQWQDAIDNGQPLPPLYILQIAIGAEGVTEEYMWHPARKQRLIPGPLGTVDISLFPFAKHIFSLLDGSLPNGYEIIGLHWRGGENDVTATTEHLTTRLQQIYETIFEEFNTLLHTPPVVLHKLVCPDRMHAMDPTGGYLKNMDIINTVFDRLATTYKNVTVFDPRTAPQFSPNVCGNGIFKEDLVHFTEEVNQWVARRILEGYTHEL